MKSLAIGIDLGTTNSAIAYINATGRPEVVPNQEGSPITPSVIDFSCDPPRVGEEAKESQGLGEESIASFFKRSMGDPNFVLQLGGEPRTAIDLSALVLKKLKEDAEAKLGTPITQAVITVPAYFNNAQREATIEAGRRAGLEVLRIINEPTAAALAFGLHESKTTQRVLVYDLGGGTFDVSLVEITPDNISVRATDGDHNLGGKDWDDRVAVYLGQSFAEAHGVNPLDNNVSFNDLLVRAEDAKKQLSSRNSTRVAIHYDGQREAYELTREKFQELTQDLMERTQCLAEQVLVEAGMKWTDLTGVLLVGGSTRMPMVHDYVRQMSGKEPMTGVNVDEAVALGAAIQAAIDLREKSGGKQETFFLGGSRRIQDVMSHSLGVIALDESQHQYVNSIIIAKNTPVPTTRARPYRLQHPRRKSNQLEIYVVQGESRDPEKCTATKKYVLCEAQDGLSAPSTIEIAYGYNTNGIITVEAKDTAKGTPLPLRAESIADGDGWLRKLNESLHFDPASLRLSVTAPSYDDIGAILRSMKVAFHKYSDQKFDCDILFLNCGTSDVIAPEDLRGFVEQGGSVYASCYMDTLIQSAFPKYFRFGGHTGRVCTMRAEVEDREVIEILGKTIDVTFDTTWATLDSVAEGVRALLRSKDSGKPLMAMTDHGNGTIFFTCFHNRAQVSLAERKLLQFLIMKQMSVVAGIPVEVVAGALKMC